MLGHAVARQPAPMLAMRPIGLRLRHGVDALGNAIGESIASSSQPESSGGSGLRLPRGNKSDWWNKDYRFDTPSASVAGDDGPSFAESVQRVAAAQGMTTRNALFNRGVDDGSFVLAANGGGLQYRPQRVRPEDTLLSKFDGFLDRTARWSSESVGPAFDAMILDAASQGRDGVGVFLTGLRVVATASSDAVSGMAGLARLGTSQDVRDQFMSTAQAVLDDPVGTVTRAYDKWMEKAWYEQLEDVYKVFQGTAASIGIAGKARGLFSVAAVDDLATLGGNTQKVLRAYQSAYDDAAAAFKVDLDAGNIVKPEKLNFNTWAGNKIDAFARDEMLTWKQLEGMDDLLVNRRLMTPGGAKDFRIPDLFVPGERTVIDGTIGSKGLTTPQIQDFFQSGKVDRVVLVSPNQRPVVITLEQFKAGKH